MFYFDDFICLRFIQLITAVCLRFKQQNSAVYLFPI